MRLSRTFGLGAALAVLPLVAGLAFTVDRLQDLASQSERLMLRQLTAVRLGTGVATRLDRLGEYQSKFAVAHDDAYADKAQQVARAIDAEVNTLRAADLGTSEDVALAAFIQRWQHYRQTAWAVDDNHDNHDNGDADGSDGDVDSASRRQVAEIEGLAVTARELLTNAHAAAIADVADADDTRAAAWRAAITATGVALLSSVSVLWFVVRRLRQRLDDFVEASVAVSRGAFSAQLPAGGDDELGRVATAFNDMVVALEQLERLKSDFISSISHELRTPLARVITGIETTLRRSRDVDTLRSALEAALHETRSLALLADALLAMSRADASEHTAGGSTDIAVVINEVCESLSEHFANSGLALDVAAVDVGLVVGDDLWLERVVANLLENALKYTPRGGHVCVRLQRTNHVVTVVVEDDGPGIAAAEHERVFERFFRSTAVRGSVAGFGLGLPLARDIARRYGGDVVVDPMHTAGARLVLRLRAASPP